MPVFLLRRGIPPKSNWMTAEPWFSKTSDSARRTAKKPLPKTILARRTGKLRSKPMNFPPKSPHPARSRPSAEHSSFQRFSFQRFSFSRSPLFPRNPLFPALRSGPTAVSGASRQKQIPSSPSSLVAIGRLGVRVLNLKSVRIGLLEWGYHG